MKRRGSSTGFIPKLSFKQTNKDPSFQTPLSSSLNLAISFLNFFPLLFSSIQSSSYVSLQASRAARRDEENFVSSSGWQFGGRGTAPPEISCRARILPPSLAAGGNQYHTSRSSSHQACSFCTETKKEREKEMKKDESEKKRPLKFHGSHIVLLQTLYTCMMTLFSVGYNLVCLSVQSRTAVQGTLAWSTRAS